MGWFRWEVYWIDPLDTPPANVYETDQALVVEIALPGLEVETIRITVEGPFLHIVAPERVLPTSIRRFLRMEIPTGPFRFELRIPSAFDLSKIQSTWAHGILRIQIPRKSWREIPIEESKEGETHNG